MHPGHTAIQMILPRLKGVVASLRWVFADPLAILTHVIRSLDEAFSSRYAVTMAAEKNILAAIDKANPMRARSPLARWMLQNYDAFAARYTPRRADWSVLAQVFAEAGLTDADGKPLNRVTARKTWQRVQQMRRQMALAESPQTRQPPSPSPTAAVPLGEDNQDPPPRRFGKATLRGHTPSAPAPPPMANPVLQPNPDRADKIIADLLGGQPRGRFAPKTDDGE
jgi:hypothetical protein